MVSCNEADQFLFLFTLLGCEAGSSLFFYAEKKLDEAGNLDQGINFEWPY